MTARFRLLPIALRVAGLLLLGAAAFGAWHVVVGGLVNGNGRAAAFGAALATASLIVLVGIVAVDRRLRGA
jgi:hypothetical protein